jgi:cytochrome c oxidase cbb3-type subunit 2
MLGKLYALIRKLVAPFGRMFHAIFRSMYRLERYSLGLAAGIVVAGGIGGAVEIAPLFTIDSTVEDAPGMRLYTPLEQAGRDIYLREGCYTCHSQMIRTLRDEVDRWGPYSLAVESKYDHPMLWGSKRTGPDLARVGGKYSDDWHFAHLYYPRDVSPDSVMPAYRWLARRRAELDDLPARLATLRRVGVPYTDEQIANAVADARGQVDPDGERAVGLAERYGEATNIRNFDGQGGAPTEMDAMIAYLQVLGQLVDPDTIAAAQARVEAGEE